MTGFSTFRTSELHPVPGASSAPEPWCSPGWRADASQHCRIPAAGPKPQKTFHRQGSALRGFIQRFTLFALPDFPRTSPLLLPVDGSHGSRDFPRASHPTAQTLCDACRERGRALSTHPELTTSHTALHSVSSLETCDLVSQRQKRSSSSTPNGSPVRSSGLRPVPRNYHPHLPRTGSSATGTARDLGHAHVVSRQP